jgi:hypothetical protein
VGAGGSGYEPPGIRKGQYRGYDPKLDALRAKYVRNPFSDQFDGEHLYFFGHVYGNDSGTGSADLYVPVGSKGQPTSPTKTDAIVTLYYPHLWGLTNITLAVFHVGDFAVKPAGNRIQIGTIGGPGGNTPGYMHSHIEVWSGRTGYLPPGDKRDAARMSFSQVFCK